MKVRMKSAIVPLAALLLGGPTSAAFSQTSERPTPAPTAAEEQPPAETGTAQAVAPPAGAASLRVFVGKSMVVDSAETLRRVSVTDPAIASATIISPRQVLIHGHRLGSVTLILWNERDEIRSFELDVELDLGPLRETMRQTFPGETIEASQSGASIVLSGKVSSKGVGEQAVALAQTHAEKVVSLLVEGGAQVLLKVRVAEVNRAAIQELGLNVFGTGLTLGDANIIGNLSTTQFVDTLGNVGAVPPDVQRGRDPQAPNLAAGGIGNTAEGTPAVFGLSDLLNLFLFLPDRNLGVVVRALEQRNLLEILAEPNLLAQNGREASFLAGGEFPFPTVQGISGGLPAVSIQFREFGVRLRFTPTILANGRISLKLVQEVSSLDFSNALTISGFLVPALSTRRAETELEIGQGENFAIAGLIDNRVTEVASKIPWLGDLPIIGKLFRSRALQRVNTELLVMVTPQLVGPMAAAEAAAAGPSFPKPFLDKDKFDEVKEKKPPQ
jgi:pilus assembly protein CpaC